MFPNVVASDAVVSRAYYPTDLGRAMLGLRNAMAGARDFGAALAAGQIRLDPDAANSALDKIASAKAEVAQLINNATMLGRRMKLGANPVGEPMAEKFANRGDHDPASWRSVLNLYHGVLDGCEHSIKKAIATCQRVDRSNAANFNQPE